jgi:hypothetical protein
LDQLQRKPRHLLYARAAKAQIKQNPPRIGRFLIFHPDNQKQLNFRENSSKFITNARKRAFLRQKIAANPQKSAIF